MNRLVCLYVCMYVCLSVTLFLKPLYSTTYTFYRNTYKIQNRLNKKNTNFWFIYFFKSRCSQINLEFYNFILYLPKYTFHADIFVKYKIFLVKKYNIFVFNFFKSRLCFYINLDFLQFLIKSAKIYILQIYYKI